MKVVFQKTPSGYKVFLNSGYNESGQNNKYWNTQYDTSIKDGDRVNLKIINNGNGTVTMYVNGIPRYEKSACIWLIFLNTNQ